MKKKNGPKVPGPNQKWNHGQAGGPQNSGGDQSAGPVLAHLLGPKSITTVVVILTASLLLYASVGCILGERTQNFGKYYADRLDRCQE